jgi:hypothetical protein
MTKMLFGMVGLAAASLVGLAGCGELPEQTGEAASAATTPDFVLLNGPDTPTTDTVKRGSGGLFEIVLEPLNGFDGVVTFTGMGLPVATTSGFSSPTLTGSGSTTFDFQTIKSGHGGPGDRGTPTGTFTLTFTGTSGALSHSVTATTTIR